MRLEKRVVRAGDSRTFPTIGDTVETEYTCWLYNESKESGRGKEYVEAMNDSRKSAQPDRVDSSRGHGGFKHVTGVGEMIKGWDILINQMSLGERSIMHIPAALGYGSRGFGNSIPANADLIFDVTLKSIQRD